MNVFLFFLLFRLHKTNIIMGFIEVLVNAVNYPISVFVLCVHAGRRADWCVCMHVCVCVRVDE